MGNELFHEEISLEAKALLEYEGHLLIYSFEDSRPLATHFSLLHMLREQLNNINFED